jgi:hypothetical protein
MGDWSDDDDVPAAVSLSVDLYDHFSQVFLICRSQRLSPRKTMMTGEIQTRKAADLDLQVNHLIVFEF